MKHLLWLATLLPFYATAQINGTLQKTVATKTIRGNFGSSGIDSLVSYTGALTNGYILQYNSTSKKWDVVVNPTIGLSDSLAKKANRTFDNVASGAIANSKLANSSIKINGSDVSLGGATGLIDNPNSIGGKKAVFFGTSITAGSGATTLAQRYSSLLSGYLGATEINYGSAGSTLEKRSPIDANGGVNMVDQLPNVPTYDETYGLLVVSHGINDVGYNGTNYTTTNYKADYETILTYIITTKGWPAKSVLIIGPEYMSTAGYALYDAAYPANPPTGLARHLAFIEASKEESEIWGTMYLDIYDVFVNNGSTSLLLDNIHPNDAGHLIYARAAYKYLSGSYPFDRNANSLTLLKVANRDTTSAAGAGIEAIADGGSSYLYRNSTTNVANPNETILLGTGGSSVSIIGGSGSTAHLRIGSSLLNINTDALGTGTITTPSFIGTTSYKIRRNGLATVQSGFQLESATGTVYGQNFQLDDVGGLALWSYNDGTATWVKAWGVTKAGSASYPLLTASTSLALNASKEVVSVANTGTGNNVLSVSPALTGSPTAPTQTAGDNSTKIATTAYVDTRASSGAWTTPTVTNLLNVSSSSSQTGHYIRVGNRVTAMIRITVATSGAGATAVGIDLPIPSNFTGANDLVGLGTGSYSPIVANQIFGYSDSTNDRAQIQFNSVTASTTDIYLQVQYEVK